MSIKNPSPWSLPRKLSYVNSTFWMQACLFLIFSLFSHGLLAKNTALLCTTDTVAPVISNCPSDTIIDFDQSICGAKLTWPDIVATDNCDPNPVIWYSHMSGDTFPQSTLVLITATDSTGLVTECNFFITVANSGFKITACPSNITTFADANCQAIVSWDSPSYIDNCNSSPTLDSTHIIGAFFDVDSTEVRYTLTNSIGNRDTCSFLVIVNDNTPPLITGCDLDTTIYTSINACTQAYSWDEANIIVSDNCDVIKIPDSSYQSTDNFPLGTTTVTYSALDASGKTTDCSFDVTVLDTFPPVATTCPNDTIVEVFSVCDTMVSWIAPIFTDACDGTLDITQNFNSGASYPTGIYAVDYSATDHTGNVGHCIFLLTVKDNIAPTLEPCPADTTISVVANCEVTYNYIMPAATDLCSSTIIPVATPATTSFSIGSNLITITATDNGGNTTDCSFTVTAVDNASPTTICPQGITINSNGTILSDPSNIIQGVMASGCDMPIINFSFPEIVDNCQAMLTDSSVLMSSFPVGTTIFSYNYSDLSGNGQVCTFEVNVVADTQLVIIMADNNPVCPGSNVVLSSSVTSSTADFLWSGPFSFASNSPTPTINNFMFQNIGEYSVTITDGGCQLQPATPLHLTIAKNIAANTDAHTMPINTTDTIEVLLNDELSEQNVVITIDQEPLNGSVEVINNKIVYTPDAGYSGLDQMFYQVCVENCSQFCATAQVNIEINLAAGTDTCIIPNLITPNDDNLNDGLILDCLTTTNEASKLLIYNQWGGLVFKAAPYLNDWTGYHKDNPDRPLPDGTYFYIFWKDTQQEPQKGFITLFR